MATRNSAAAQCAAAGEGGGARRRCSLARAHKCRTQQSPHTAGANEHTNIHHWAARSFPRGRATESAHTSARQAVTPVSGRLLQSALFMSHKVQRAPTKTSNRIHLHNCTYCHNTSRHRSAKDGLRRPRRQCGAAARASTTTPAQQRAGVQTARFNVPHTKRA